MIKILTFVLLLHVTLAALAIPQTFSSLASEIDTLANAPFETLDERVSLPYEALRECRDNAFSLGYELQAAREKHSGESTSLRRAYLKRLRSCETLSKQIQALYASALYDCMERNDYGSLEALLGLSLPLQPSLKCALLEYYEPLKKTQRIRALEMLNDEADMEEQSRALMAEEYAAYEAQLQVIAQSEAQRLSRSKLTSQRQSVLVYSQKSDTGYTLYGKNRNTFGVSGTLELKALRNAVSSHALPLYFELEGNSEKKLLTLTRENPYATVSFASRYSWVMGSASAQHADVFYRLPFKSGRKVRVSQGFYGAASHKNKHAVDFPLPIGTPIYAARGGKVVAAQESHAKGKFDKSYGKYANYIVIEHPDKTHGNYYHLKQHGVAVSIGDSVKTGALIGYSGNTGYTSGPHLHFSVSKVDPKTRTLPKTVEFVFKNGSEIIKNPKKGDVFTVQ